MRHADLRRLRREADGKEKALTSEKLLLLEKVALLTNSAEEEKALVAARAQQSKERADEGEHFDRVCQARHGVRSRERGRGARRHG